MDGMYWWLAARGEVSCERDHAAIPSPIYRLLGPAELIGYASEGPSQAGYEDRDDALANLSRACVGWGQSSPGCRRWGNDTAQQPAAAREQ